MALPFFTLFQVICLNLGGFFCVASAVGALTLMRVIIFCLDQCHKTDPYGARLCKAQSISSVSTTGSWWK